MIPKVIVTCPVALGYQYAHSSLIRDSDIYIYLRYICINDIYIYIYTMWVLFIFEKFHQNIKSESSETCTIEEPQRLVIADKRN